MGKFSRLPNGLQSFLLFFGLFNIFIQVAWAADINFVPSSLSAVKQKQPAAANLCPLPERIQPCTCNATILGGITCEGSSITQATIIKVIAELREVNGVAPDDLLSTDRWYFTVRSTSLSNFDLSPLFNTQFQRVSIIENANLTRIHGVPSGSNGRNVSSIDALFLDLYRNNLTDEGLVDCFQYFSTSLLELNIRYNLIQGPISLNSKASGVSDTQEFLPGLWKFVHLHNFHFDNNKVTILRDSPFKPLSELQILQIGCVDEVGENAFYIDNLNTSSTHRIIVLSDETKPCWLSDRTFHRNHGLLNFGGQTILHLKNNAFDFLDQKKFEALLNVHPNNMFNFYNNGFYCDWQMKWLKDGKASYERRVSGIDCINDPGRTIFTTNLV